ncbi:MAG TPA: universal stress protein [Bryobacteraceae bacterium]|jgi:nucleotide-binding universal stress UspA family protein
MEFRHILFPVDFSKPCQDAASWVNAMAELFQAKVTLLSVIEIPSILCSESGGTLRFGAVSSEDIEHFCRGQLEAFRTNHFLDARAEIVQAEGDPATVIGRHVEANSVDLIMMPTRGHGPFRPGLLGSVTAKVLHDVKCSVWTTSHSETLSPDPLRCDTILCSVDALESAESTASLIRSAAALAERFKARLALVHATPSHSELADEAAGIPARSAEAQIRANAARLQEMAGVKASVCIKHGSVEALIRSAVREYRAGLVVIGRGHLADEKDLFRSHVYWIVRASPCPVLSVYVKSPATLNQ